MLNFNKFFININRFKRDIKEVNYSDINLNEFIVIDVRSRREYKEGHLNNAINIPLFDIKRNIENKVTNKDAKILLYCTSGVRSKKAAEIIENIGYNQVYNLKGGIENI